MTGKKMPIKAAADDNLKYFTSIFRENIAWNTKPYFLRYIIENKIKMFSATISLEYL